MRRVIGEKASHPEEAEELGVGRLNTTPLRRFSGPASFSESSAFGKD
jgi:hypothetical protein